MKKITPSISAIVLGLCGAQIAHADDCSTYPLERGATFESVEGSVLPRILSTGYGVPFSEDADDVEEAYQIAKDDALQAITEFMNLAVSSSRDRERVTERLTEQSGNNREASKRQVDTVVEAWSRSSSAMLRGVVNLGSCYTPGSSGFVMWTVGIKPETVAMAAGLSDGMADSFARSPTLKADGSRASTGNAEGSATPKEGNLRKLPGSSNTKRISDF